MTRSITDVMLQMTMVPREDVHEEEFTTKEAKAFSKVVRRDHWTLLFCDLSLADKVVVTGGTSK
jgi:hypothetical protein